ncbi:MAG: gamma-glutamyl-gamma-aminobutyrate hydrolase family protein [Acidobacteriota bacterium]
MRRAPGRIVLSTAAGEKVDPYREALLGLGVAAERLQVVRPTNTASPDVALSGAAGLLLCGGADVDPRRYGEKTLADARVHVQPERDDLEWELLAGARERRMPVLGICRGVQVMNAFLGGTLWQDLPLQTGTAIEHSHPRPLDALPHTVEVAADRHPVARRMGEGTLPVNSRHHQGIRALAPGLVALARSADGLVEACALSPGDGWWLAGVQWHPENLLRDPRHRGLFLEFLQAAAVPAGEEMR